MEDRQFEILFAEADRRRRRGEYAAAIEMAKRALALDPDHARAHAVLALALLGARRLHGASIEVGLALALDGNDAFCHYAAAAVRAAERRLEDAWQHCLVALESDSTDLHAHVLGARIRRMRGELAEARELLDEALAIRADDPDALTMYARLELALGHADEARRRIDAALAAEPDHLAAHVVAGQVALHRGDLAAAEEHARYALAKSAADQDALMLWTALKARKHPLLGLWWRFNSFASLRSERGQLAILIGSFVLVRLLVILVGALGHDGWEQALTYVWLAFCAYTWIAPSVFRRMLARELETVALRPDY